MKKILVAILLAGIIGFFSGNIPSASAKQDDIKLKVFVHYPNPHGQPAAPSTCSPTTNDQVNDYLWAGWQMPNAGMTYKVNFTTKPENLTNKQVANAVSASFATWNSADAKQIFSYAGTTSAKNARYDGTNAILWKAVQSSAIAITYVWYYPATGQLVEADTVFNKLYKWSSTPYAGSNDCGGATGAYDLANIATHEFGHWIGLDDLYAEVDKDLTMYGYGDLAELKKDSLGLGDVTGVNGIAP